MHFKPTTATIDERSTTVSVLSVIGNTPLTELIGLNGNSRVRILGKLEGNNPGGSVKDRPAYYMLKKAEESAIVYSTCSLLPIENEEVIKRFLAAKPEFELKQQRLFIGTPSPMFPLAQRLLPHINHTDGFSIFKLGYREI